jgi:hypothetical protein
MGGTWQGHFPLPSCLIPLSSFFFLSTLQHHHLTRLQLSAKAKQDAERAHLQAFLDTSAHSALLLPSNFPAEDRPQLAKTVEARSDYLVAAAAQLQLPPLIPQHNCTAVL